MASERVTLRQLARLAGVSVTTASDALSGRGRVHEETRQRLVSLAGQLGYRPNHAARSLRQGRVDAVGLYFPADVVSMPYYMTLAQGAVETAATRGIAMTLIPPWRDVEKLRSFPIDGLIIVDPTLDDPLLDQLNAWNVPVVACERDLEESHRYSGGVTSEHGPVMIELLDHLAAQGAETIAFLVPPPATSWAVQIVDAYRQWCARHGRTPLDTELKFASYPSDVRREVATLLDRSPRPDAIISAHDGGAIGVLMAAAERGLSVPGDLLVACGVDSDTLQLCSPTITAIDLEPRQMGHQAADLLVTLARHEPVTALWSSVVPQLKVRASTQADEGRPSGDR